MDWLDLLAVQDSQESSPTPQFKSIRYSELSFLYSPTLTSIHDYWKNHSLGEVTCNHNLSILRWAPGRWAPQFSHKDATGQGLSSHTLLVHPDGPLPSCVSSTGDYSGSSGDTEAMACVLNPCKPKRPRGSSGSNDTIGKHSSSPKGRRSSNRPASLLKNTEGDRFRTLSIAFWNLFPPPQ